MPPQPKLSSEFRHGLTVVFDASKILLPYRAGKPVTAEPKLSVAGAAEISDLKKSARRFSRSPAFPLSRPDRVWSWFDSLTTAGTLIIVPDGADAEIRLSHAAGGRSSVHRTVVMAGEGSSVSVIEDVSGGDSVRAVRTASTEVIAGRGSAVRYARLQSLGKAVDEFWRLRSTLDDSARLDIVEGVFGGGFCQSSKQVSLSGQSSSVTSRCLFIAGRGQSFDFEEGAFHAADRTSSDLIERGAVAAAGHAAVRPTIRIPKGIAGCSGAQKGDIITLGPGAEADAVPDLEIGTDAVSCSHSASIGRLDDEQLFHLMGKGLTAGSAAGLMIEGFFRPLSSGLPAALSGDVNRLVASKLDDYGK
jgi:Fe-S cluster assembly scaffold protein SufB